MGRAGAQRAVPATSRATPVQDGPAQDVLPRAPTASPVQDHAKQHVITRFPERSTTPDFRTAPTPVRVNAGPSTAARCNAGCGTTGASGSTLGTTAASRASALGRGEHGDKRTDTATDGGKRHVDQWDAGPRDHIFGPPVRVDQLRRQVTQHRRLRRTRVGHRRRSGHRDRGLGHAADLPFYVLHTRVWSAPARHLSAGSARHHGRFQTRTTVTGKARCVTSVRRSAGSLVSN